jgi:hypothetical protein
MPMRNFGMALQRTVLSAVVSLIFVQQVLADPVDERVAALQEKLRCPIFELLLAVHRTPLKTKERYVVIAIKTPDGEGAYTQCIFFNKDQRMHCEAASPFYNQELKSFFTKERIALLKNLGYTTRPSKNNYHLEPKIAGLDSIYAVAGLYVETLGRVFDMQPSDNIIYHAPLVPKMPPPSAESAPYCHPMVSLR